MLIRHVGWALATGITNSTPAGHVKQGETTAGDVGITLFSKLLGAAGVEAAATSTMSVGRIHGQRSINFRDAIHEASYTVTLQNDSNVTLSRLVVWIDASTEGLKISDDGAAWVSPTTEAAGLSLPDLLPGATDTLHIRRTVAAGAASDPDVLNLLQFRFDGL